MNSLFTPLDIQQQSFKRALRGYDPEEVDEFLDKVAENFQGYAEKIRDLERKLETAEEQIKECRELKHSLNEAILFAQQSAEEKIKSAAQKAELTLNEARVKADSIVDEAKSRIEEQKRELGRLTQVRQQFVAEMKGTLSKFETLIGLVSESGRPSEKQ
ncbi:MAG: DivIVA domain-containing protein [Synergistales bacterium]